MNDQPVKVLLVEDNLDDSQLVRAWLAEVKGSPFCVEWTDRLSEGLARLATGGIDVVLLDLSLPDSRGLDTFSRVHRQAPQIPVVILTDFDDELVAEKAVRGGAQDYLVKGQEGPNSLARTVRYAIERRRGEEIRTQLQTQIARAEKLAALGQLWAGVAHKLNKPLSVVIGETLLLGRTVKDGPLKERADKIARAAERCGRIVKNFLALARQHAPQRQPVRLNHVVKGAVELLADSLRVDGIGVTLDLDAWLPVVSGDPHELHQVVVNLVSNAHGAMRASLLPRRLTLTTRYQSERARIVLAVADTGPGIPPEVQTRIFEPFFTTRPRGEGTGLGLSLCQGIVATHGGTIRVASVPGAGTVFSVELPVETTPPDALELRGEEPTTSRVGKRIPVVDDEPEVAPDSRDQGISGADGRARPEQALSHRGCPTGAPPGPAGALGVAGSEEIQ